MEEIKIGNIVTAKVTSVKPYAAFLSFEDGSNGLLHISEISDKFIKDIEQYVSKGDTLKVLILSIDETDHFIRTSYKKVPNELKENSHTNGRTKPIINDSDFEPLKNKLPEWIKESLKEKNGDK